MWRYPDNPVCVDLEHVRGLQDGEWIGQPKMDGWRHIVSTAKITTGSCGNVYNHTNKTGNFSRIDLDLLREFNRYSWSPGIGFDCELMGPRHKGQQQTLWLFDVLYWRGQFCADIPFCERIEYSPKGNTFDGYGRLPLLMQEAARVKLDPRGRIKVLPYRTTDLPGFFGHQLCDPMSEGLVLRRRDQKIIGSYTQSADNPLMLKVKHSRAPKELAIK